MDIQAIKSLADQADELGYFEFDLQGGELLLQPDKLFEVLEAIKPERFYLYLTTNGYHLDEKMAKGLQNIKLVEFQLALIVWMKKFMMKLGVEKTSWRRAIEALEHVKNNGIDPYLNITVGRYNIGTDHLKQLLDYSKQKKI